MTIAGWKGYGAYERAQLSPFVMGTTRAGMPFSVVDDEAKREMGHGFTCKKLDKHVRFCDLITDTPVGELKILVDRWGRAAVIQLLVTDTSYRWLDRALAQEAEWSEVHARQPAYPEPERSVTRWESDDHRWSALVARQRQTNHPVELTVVDGSRLGHIAAANPAILLRVASDGMISPADLAVAERYASASIAKATDSMSAEGIALARKASTLPRCAPVPGDQIGEGDGMRTTMGPELASVAEQTVARAFPGNKLVLGDRAAYLVDAAGAAEEIIVYPNAAHIESNLYAFAVTFPRRVAAAEAAAHAFRTDARCRAPAEVIVANLDPATRQVAGLQRVEVDGESTSSVIGALDFTASLSGRPALLAMYLATYGGAEWYGQVKWNEIIDVNHPLVVQQRAPTSVVKNDPDDVMTGGLVIPEGASPDDAWGFTVKPGPSAQLSVLDITHPNAPSRHLFLLAGPTGLASGWTLLSQL